MPDEETQARHFLDKLDLKRYHHMLSYLHNKLLKYPDSLQSAYETCLDHVHAVIKTGQPKDGAIDSLTSFPIESENPKGKQRKGKRKKNGDKKVEKVDEKKDQKADAPKSTPKKPQDGKDERSCFGCQKKGHLLKDCPMREKVIASYSKKDKEGNAMAAISNDDVHFSVLWPVLSVEGDVPKPAESDEGVPELDESDIDEDEEPEWMHEHFDWELFNKKECDFAWDRIRVPDEC